MKNFYIYLCVGLFAVTSCDKMEDNVFSETPDERLEKTLKEYDELLHSSPNGWLLSLETGTNGGYRFWVNFNDDKRVTMLSDLDYDLSTNWETSIQPKESSYTLKGLLAPSLIFDTYTYLHMLADPQASVNGAAANGTGLVSDFEFSLIKADNGRIYLRGNFNGCTAYLDPATPKELECITDGSLKDVYDNLDKYLDENTYPSILIGDTKLLTKPNARKTEFAYMDENDEIVEKSVGSYLDLKSETGEKANSDIYFFEPVEILGETFNEMIWNETEGCYVLTSKGHDYTVSDNEVPPYPLKFGLNQTFTKLYMETSTLEGTIPQRFMDEVYMVAYNDLYNRNSKRKIAYVQCTFSENVTSGMPQMELLIRYTNTAGSGYNAKWHYSYEINDDGTITFTDRNQTGSTNEAGREPYLKAIVDYFCTVEYEKYSTSSWANSVKSNVIPRTFRIDWAPNNTPGLTGNIGAFYPVDDEELYFVGQLSAK